MFQNLVFHTFGKHSAKFWPSSGKKNNGFQPVSWKLITQFALNLVYTLTWWVSRMKENLASLQAQVLGHNHYLEN